MSFMALGQDLGRGERSKEMGDMGRKTLERFLTIL